MLTHEITHLRRGVQITQVPGHSEVRGLTDSGEQTAPYIVVSHEPGVYQVYRQGTLQLLTGELTLEAAITHAMMAAADEAQNIDDAPEEEIP